MWELNIPFHVCHLWHDDDNWHRAKQWQETVTTIATQCKPAIISFNGNCLLVHIRSIWIRSMEKSIVAIRQVDGAGVAVLPFCLWLWAQCVLMYMCTNIFPREASTLCVGSIRENVNQYISHNAHTCTHTHAHVYFLPDKPILIRRKIDSWRLKCLCVLLLLSWC